MCNCLPPCQRGIRLIDTREFLEKHICFYLCARFNAITKALRKSIDIIVWQWLYFLKLRHLCISWRIRKNVKLPLLIKDPIAVCYQKTRFENQFSLNRDWYGYNLQHLILRCSKIINHTVYRSWLAFWFPMFMTSNKRRFPLVTW